MNKTNQLWGESQTLIWNKKVFENLTKIPKVQDCELNGFTEGKNYNPMMHCEQHDRIKNDGEVWNYSFKNVDYIYKNNIF